MILSLPLTILTLCLAHKMWNRKARLIDEVAAYLAALSVIILINLK